MQLTPVKYRDGSVAVRGPHNLVAAVFVDGPAVVYDDRNERGVPCSWAEADYVVQAFCGVRRLEEAFER